MATGIAETLLSLLNLFIANLLMPMIYYLFKLMIHIPQTLFFHRLLPFLWLMLTIACITKIRDTFLLYTKIVRYKTYITSDTFMLFIMLTSCLDRLLPFLWLMLTIAWMVSSDFVSAYRFLSDWSWWRFLLACLPLPCLTLSKFFCYTIFC